MQDKNNTYIKNLSLNVFILNSTCIQISHSLQANFPPNILSRISDFYKRRYLIIISNTYSFGAFVRWNVISRGDFITNKKIKCCQIWNVVQLPKDKLTIPIDRVCYLCFTEMTNRCPSYRIFKETTDIRAWPTTLYF